MATKKSDEKPAERKAAEAIRKITVKTVSGGKPSIEAILASPGKTLPLMDIYGVATSMKPGATDYGPYVKFLGQFEGINLATGEVFTAPALLLPKFLEEQLAGALGASANANAQFAFRLSARYDESAATNYVYVAKSLIPTKESDALAQIKMQMQAALPAPK